MDQPASPPTLAAHAPIHRKDYRPPAYLIDRIDLDLDLDAARTQVSSRLAIRPNPAFGEQVPLRLDGEEQTLISIALDGRTLAASDYVLDAKSLTLPAPPAGPFTLEIVSEIAPDKNTALEGLYLSGETLATQCEAEGFRRITYFIDRPDVLSVYRTKLTADAKLYPRLLSNGNPIGGGALPDGRHYIEWHDPFPKPCYLFAVVAGDLARVEDHFTTSSGRSVALHLYVEHGNEPRTAYAMDALKRSMKWDEDTYGLEYDLDIFQIVAVSTFNMGAMENKGLNVFNAKFILADPESATDVDYAGIEAVVAHEYFHNWTGNRITCRDWFQLSLKEGLTVFRDHQFSADMRSASVERIGDVRVLRAAQFPEDAGPLAHPVRPESYVEINNFYTATVYEKGSEVIHMLRTLIGPVAFRKGMDLYVARHDGTAATCEDFVKAMEDASGRDLTQFRRWYSQAGTPILTAETAYSASDQSLRLTLRQGTAPSPGQPVKEPFHIPIALGLVGADGHDLPLRLAGEPVTGETTRVLDLTKPEQTFVFEDVPAPPVPSLLRGFSAPVQVVDGLSSDKRAFLMAHDSDPFNRWDAAQAFGTAHVLARAGGQATDADATAFVDALGQALATPGLDPAFRALMLTLPSETELALHMRPVDPDALHDARESVLRLAAERWGTALADTYERLAPNEPYAPTAEQAGVRSLRNATLGLLARRSDAAASKRVVTQAENATNMTDQMAAFGLLADMDAPERTPLFDRFYARWTGNALVIDKWFSLQAMSARADTLDAVRKLMDHGDFTLRNPNRVRALIGAFAHGNPLRFHGADGGGYRLVADVVIALDALNPQVAARLVTAFETWRAYDKVRQAMMEAELHRIAAEAKSPNIVEKTTKLLA